MKKSTRNRADYMYNRQVQSEKSGDSLPVESELTN